MLFKIFILPAAVAFLLNPVYAEVYQLNLRQFDSLGLVLQPTRAEQELSREDARLKIKEIKSQALLPRFELNMAWGPSPGLRQEYEKEYIQYGDINDTNIISSDKLDFTKMGPYFGTEIKVAQPLNLYRLKSGLKAARSGIAVAENDFKMQQSRDSRQFQRIYNGFLLARDLHKLAKEAEKEMLRARKKIEDLLNEDDASVSQFDYLELKTQFLELNEGLLEAEKGMKRAYLGVRFALNLGSGDTLIPVDSALLPPADTLPELSVLKGWLHSAHPDLGKLKAGITARSELVKIAEAELGPEFFLFGNFKFAKSWAGDRRSSVNNALIKDPVNTLDGSLGIGVRYRLNLWERQSNLARVRMDLKELKAKDNYAEEGLGLKLEEAYDAYKVQLSRLSAVEEALRASEAWVKGAAMKYDVDPEESQNLIKAFKRNIEIRKKYFMTVFDLNESFADVLEKVGVSLQDYYNLKENSKRSSL